MLLGGAVVHAGILEVQLQVLVEEIVEAHLVHGLHAVPLLVVAIGLIAGLSMQLRLNDRHDSRGIPFRLGEDTRPCRILWIVRSGSYIGWPVC